MSKILKKDLVFSYINHASSSIPFLLESANWRDKLQQYFLILISVCAEIYAEANLPCQIVPHKNLTAWQY